MIPLKRRLDWHKVKIGLLYFVLIAGGLWHLLDVFQPAMKSLASPMIIGLAGWICGEYWYVLSRETKYKFIWWGLMVISGSFVIELFGIRTGKIFGAYSYGQTLEPLLANVPIAIGFAWFGMLLSSIAVTQKLLRGKSTRRLLLFSLVISLLMVIFDFFMEPAAIELAYWQWMGNKIPLRNYLAWFLLSCLFSYLGLRLGLCQEKMPPLAFHAYFAQLLYFGIVNLR